MTSSPRPPAGPQRPPAFWNPPWGHRRPRGRSLPARPFFSRVVSGPAHHRGASACISLTSPCSRLSTPPASLPAFSLDRQAHKMARTGQPTLSAQRCLRLHRALTPHNQTRREGGTWRRHVTSPAPGLGRGRHYFPPRASAEEYLTK